MRVPRYVIPVLVVLTLLGGYSLRAAFTRPTTQAGATGLEGARLQCTVDGVKCKGTARFFTSLYDSIPGIHGIETYATEHRAIFTYDPDIITAEGIREIMEQPILMRDGSRVRVFQCLSQEPL